MQQKILLLATILLFSSQLFGQNESPANKEGLLTIEIIIDGKTYQVQDGETFTLPEQIESRDIKIQSKKTLVFDHGSIKFTYPSFYAFEYEKDFGFQSWTLDGNNVVILYFKVDAEAPADLFVEEMTAQFGAENCTVTKKSTTLGGKRLDGKRINVKLIGQQLTYDMYQIPTDDGATHLISFQTTLDEGKVPKEYFETMKMIDQTISFE